MPAHWLEGFETGVVRFALKFPYTFYVLAALVMFVGIPSIVSMPTDIFPEINIRW